MSKFLFILIYYTMDKLSDWFESASYFFDDLRLVAYHRINRKEHKQ